MSSISEITPTNEANIEYSEVHRAKSRKTGAVVALKKILMHNEKDGVRTAWNLYWACHSDSG